ncbi:hypothetical protein, partial [Buchnera aphidicola]|uniref:hypothetical protein n=1 Tax=Buchnera aphidicola TaxID=9 RepID=UPI003463BFE6
NNKPSIYLHIQQQTFHLFTYPTTNLPSIYISNNKPSIYLHIQQQTFHLFTYPTTNLPSI